MTKSHLQYEDQVTLYDAISLARSQNKTEAYRALKDLETKYPQCVELLLWIIYTTPDYTEADRLVRLAHQLAPHSNRVAKAGVWVSRHFEKLN